MTEMYSEGERRRQEIERHRENRGRPAMAFGRYSTDGYGTFQFRKRVDDFDFDLVVQRFSFSSTPGDSLRTYFSSQAAAIKGSQNLAGISDPVIDALIEKIIAADTRPTLVTACKALDRVIRSGRYWIPHWYKGTHWLAFWDVFGRPATKPRYARGIPETWWYDRDKAAKLDQRG